MLFVSRAEKVSFKPKLAVPHGTEVETFDDIIDVSFAPLTALLFLFFRGMGITTVGSGACGGDETMLIELDSGCFDVAIFVVAGKSEIAITFNSTFAELTLGATETEVELWDILAMFPEVGKMLLLCTVVFIDDVKRAVTVIDC